MKWLLVYLIFDVSLGQLQPKAGLRAVFNSEEECDALGAQMADEIDYSDSSIKSFSTCIPESAFYEKGIQGQAFEPRK